MPAVKCHRGIQVNRLRYRDTSVTDAVLMIDMRG